MTLRNPRFSSLALQAIAIGTLAVLAACSSTPVADKSADAAAMPASVGSACGDGVAKQSGGLRARVRTTEGVLLDTQETSTQPST